MCDNCSSSQGLWKFLRLFRCETQTSADKEESLDKFELVLEPTNDENETEYNRIEALYRWQIITGNVQQLSGTLEVCGRKPVHRSLSDVPVSRKWEELDELGNGAQRLYGEHFSVVNDDQVTETCQTQIVDINDERKRKS